MESNNIPAGEGRRRRLTRALTIVVGGLLGATLVAACSGSTSVSPTTAAPQSSTTPTSVRGATAVTVAPETNTPGDIPDTTAYVLYTNSVGGYSFTHPEGWAQAVQGTSASFTDKYNGVSASVHPAGGPPDSTSALATDIPALKATEPAFALIRVGGTSLPAGPGVLIVYRRNSPPDPVTGRSVRQEVNRYEIFGANRLVTLDLFGAVGADNTDPYRRMSESLHLS